MAQEYQPRRFFRNAPNRLLERYFAVRNMLSEVDFGALTETQVEPIYQAWLKLSVSRTLASWQPRADQKPSWMKPGGMAKTWPSSSPRSRVSMNTLSGPSLSVRNTGKARWPFTTRT
jgi:hypothetical protein